MVFSTLALFLGGCSLIGANNNSNQGSLATTAPVSGNTVTYTDTGFTPATLTVKVGTVVTFMNQSSLDMWVASDPHPTHTDLPGFDEKQAVSNGVSYTYTFQKVGTWGYHDHKNPGMKGKVEVTE